MTGAGGSIGSELALQLARLNPSRLLLLDKDENGLNDTYLQLQKHACGLCVPLVADLRFTERLRHVFETFHPEVVFHAAAHKHVHLMEINPCEAIANNVTGTRNLVEQSVDFGVAWYIQISTDKAVNPTCVMGASKRVGEMIVQAQGDRHLTRFCCVRFGNVLGSRGSVVPIFRQQILEGRPVTVTHPEAQRFLMTIPEAVCLLIQAGTLAHGGEIFVLEMGQPVLIQKLARDLIELSGLRPDKDVRIEFTQMKPGEKISELLIDRATETIRPTGLDKDSIHQHPTVRCGGVRAQASSFGKSSPSGRSGGHLPVPGRPQHRVCLPRCPPAVATRHAATGVLRTGPRVPQSLSRGLRRNSFLPHIRTIAKMENPVHQTEQGEDMECRTRQATLEQIQVQAEDWSAEQVLQWAFETYGRDVAIATAFGAEGIALIDIAAQVWPTPRIFLVDTSFLFPETQSLIEQVEQRYQLSVERIVPSLTPEAQAEVCGPALWERDPDLCCLLRKVEPLRRKLAELRAWTTSIRREQTAARAHAKKIEWDSQFSLIKINPLADWTHEMVWQRIRTRNLAYNPLHDLHYPSIGCTHCTRAVAPGENPRAGRWSGFVKQECGLHLPNREASSPSTGPILPGSRILRP